MPTLWILAGLPGSGKSTLARAWVEQDPDRRARVSRDDLRAMLRGLLVWQDPGLEAQVTVAAEATVAALLAGGVDVVVDATNLVAAHRARWEAVAARAGATAAVWPVDTTVEECVRRDASRPPERRVGEEVIRRLAADQT